MRSRNSNFSWGGCYPCSLCGRKTRHTGEQSIGSELCPQCYELCGMDNYCNDNGESPEAAGYVKSRDRMIGEIAKRGGNAERVKGFCSYLFP